MSEERNNRELGFRKISDKRNYCVTVPYKYGKRDVLMQVSNSDKNQISYYGKHFKLYEGYFSIYNAQIDWHKRDGRYGLDEVSFVNELERCYRILKYLNPEIYMPVFKESIKGINNYSNFRFNEEYVLDVLCPLWDSNNRSLKEFVKHRDWEFKNDESVSRNDFIKFLNDDIYRFRLTNVLYDLREALDERSFIKLEDIGLNKDSNRTGYGQIVELINKWNREYIGVKTIKSDIKREYFYSNLLESNEELLSGIKNSTLHIEPIYILSKKLYQDKSYKEIADITGVKNKTTIKDFLNYEPSEEAFYSVYDTVDYYIDNIDELVINRAEMNGNTRIIGFTLPDQVKHQDIETLTDYSEVDLYEEVLELAEVTEPSYQGKVNIIRGLTDLNGFSLN